MVTVILCVFLLSYVYGEGKVIPQPFDRPFKKLTSRLKQSNYFKGSILVLTYLVIVVGFYLSGYSQNIEMMSRFDTLGLDGHYETFRTVGRGSSGRAY